jgi:tetratricopeptide (TPR) repeat protein
MRTCRVWALRFAVLVVVAGAAARFAGCATDRVSAAAARHNLQGTKELDEARLDAARLDDAEARFRLALELSPRFAEAHANLGLVLALRGEFERALDSLTAAVAIDPDLAAAHVGLGNVYAAQHRILRAIDAYETALSIQPEMPEPRRNLIRLLVARENFQAARAHALRLAQLEPAREETIATLAYCEVRLGRAEAALARLEGADAVRLAASAAPVDDAREPAARSTPALALVWALALVARAGPGDVEGGLGRLEALSRDPEHGEAARLRLAAILADLGRFDEARARCAESRRRGDDQEALAVIENTIRAGRARPTRDSAPNPRKSSAIPPIQGLAIDRPAQVP